jgi:uncharacterized protein
MAVIIRILLIVFAIYLLRWIFAYFRKSPKTAGSGAGNHPNRMVKDPMCGMYMDARLAIRLDSRKGTIYFCSEECKKKYLNTSANEGIGSAVAD